MLARRGYAPTRRSFLLGHPEAPPQVRSTRPARTPSVAAPSVTTSVPLTKTLSMPTGRPAACAGLGLLFGDGEQEQFEDNLYPNVGVGMFRYVGEGRMAIRADYAWGSEGNHGFYLTFNQPF